MSKKLLMNKFNSGGSGEPSPVQDGLACWLDAFDLTSFAKNTIWPDRTNNGNNGTVTNFKSLTSISNGMLEASGVVDIPNPTKGLTNYTVEIGYHDTQRKYWMGLWGNTSKAGTSPDGTSFYQQNYRILSYPFEFSPPTLTAIQGGKNYVSVVFSTTGFKIYINGQQYFEKIYDSSSTLNPSNANYLCFMGRKPNTVGETVTNGADIQVAKWYFIRIYNRALTEQEIINNYNYELSLGRG